MESYRDYQNDEQVVPYFLPQSEHHNKPHCGGTGLARWNFEDVARKDHPVTAENGRPPSGGGRMVYHACRTISRWRKSGKEVLPVFVYLPATELYKSDIDEYIAKCAAEFQLEASMITPVVDISTLLVAPDTAKAQLQKLHDIGVKLCVEGNIYEQGRPELLEDYPLSFVKFSRALTAGIEKKPERLDYLSSLHKKYDAMGIRRFLKASTRPAI